MNDDAALLRRYADEKSEAAFTELVRRHLDLVYSAALRRLHGDAHRAADVAQQVFATLARDAKKLSGHTVLTAWLYTATRNAAIDFIRAEQRRHVREQEALTMETLFAATPDAEWEKLRPVLDEVMDELSDADRTAVLLRFFEKRAFAEIGTALHLSEDAARMRVDRALEKLRALLGRRGVTSTSAALTAVLANQVVTAAPAGLAGTISATTIGVSVGIGGAAGSATWSTLTGASIVAALMVATVLGVAVYEFRESRATAESMAALRTANQIEAARLAELGRRVEVATGAMDTLQRAVVVARAAPSASAGTGGGGGGGLRGNNDMDSPEAIAAGEKFLMQHPEAQHVLKGMRRDQFDAVMASQLAALQLSPAEYERVFDEWARHATWTFKVQAPSWSYGFRGSFPEESLRRLIRALVGEERSQAFKPSFDSYPPERWVRALAGILHDSDAPLTDSQAAAFEQTLAQITTGARPRSLMRNSPVWATAQPALSQVLSEKQLAALEQLRESGLVRPRM